MWEKSYNPVFIHEWVPSGWASQVALMVKNLPANAGDVEMRVQSLGQEDPLEEGTATHSSDPKDREAWWATVHRVTESDTTEVT